MLNILSVLVFFVATVSVFWVIYGTLVPALPRMIKLLTVESNAHLLQYDYHEIQD